MRLCDIAQGLRQFLSVCNYAVVPVGLRREDLKADSGRAAPLLPRGCCQEAPLLSHSRPVLGAVKTSRRVVSNRAKIFNNV